MFQARRFAYASHERTASEDADPEGTGAIEQAVVVFVHAEQGDEDRREQVLRRAAKNVKWLANKRGLQAVALHSFTHLSESKASAQFAREFLGALAARLDNGGYDVAHTPFGHSCAWQLDVYGEPIAKVFKAI